MKKQAFLLAAFGTALVMIAGAGAPLGAQTIAIVGADPQSGLKFTTPVESAAFSLPLELDQGDVKDFTVAVDDFVGPDSRVVPVTVTLDGKTLSSALEIKQADRRVLQIAARFPVTGDYKSRVVLLYGGKRAPSIPLTVTRQLAAISLRVDGVESRDATIYRTGRASVRFVVQETGGQQVTIDPPAIVNLSVKRSEKSQREAHYRAVDLRRLDEGDPAPGDVCVKGSLAKGVAIQPQGHAEFLLTLCDLEEAGEYTGTIRISNRDSAPADKTVTLLVKKGGFIAFFFIFLGVSASWLVRRWTKEEKPRLEGLRRVEDLVEDLDAVEASAGPLIDVERRVMAGLRDGIEKARRTLDRGNPTAASTALDALDKKIAGLPRWLNAGRRLKAVGATLDVSNIRRDWEALADSYFLAPAPKEEDFTTKIDAAIKAVDDAVKNDAIRRATEFQTLVEAYKTANPGDAAALDRDVKPVVDAAVKAPTDGRLDEAGPALARAKARYAQFLIDKLEAALTKAAPAGFTAPAWKALVDAIAPKAADVKNETDPDRALALYDAVNREYMTAVIDAADGYASRLDKDVAASGTIAPADKTTLAADLVAASADFTAARAHLALGKTADASHSYEQGVSRLRAVEKAMGVSGGGALGMSTAAAAGAMEALPTLPPGFAVPPAPPDLPGRPVRGKPLAEKLSERIRRYDLAFNAGVLIVATVLGMKLLWADDPVWGGWLSYTIAFLWGLGLQQVGGAGFEGLPAIGKKLTE